jgi:hypothetical protein
MSPKYSYVIETAFITLLQKWRDNLSKLLTFLFFSVLICDPYPGTFLGFDDIGGLAQSQRGTLVGRFGGILPQKKNIRILTAKCISLVHFERLDLLRIL